MWEKYSSANTIQRVDILRQWQALARSARQKAPNWKPEAQWRNVLAKLSHVPTENPELCEPASMLYQAVGEYSEDSLAFCEAWAQSKEGNRQNNIEHTILLLKSISATSDRARNIVIGFSKEMDNPNTAFDFLRRNFPNDATVKEIIIKDLESQFPNRRNAAMQSIPYITLDAGDSAKIIRRLIALETHEVEACSFATYLDNAFQQSPAAFRQCLDPVDSINLLKIAENNPRLQGTCLVGIILGSKALPEDFVNILLIKCHGQNKLNSIRWLALLGFLPKGEFRGERSQLIEIARNGTNEDRAGLFSMFWRSGKDFETANKEWQSALGRSWLPDQTYWEAIAGCATAWPIVPEKWRKQWEDSLQSIPGTPKGLGSADRRLILKSITASPEASEVSWVLEQSLLDPELREEILPTLWEMRGDLIKCKLSDEIKAWLNQKTTLTDSKQAIIAAGILLFAYDDRSTCRKILEGVQIPQMFAGKCWPPAVDILLKLDSTDKRLDTYKEMLENKKGSKWLIWLLDIRRQTLKELPPPPIDSLADALRTAQTAGMDWLPAFYSAGNQISPFLDDLRSPYLFVVGSEQFHPILKFLGVLDRLEISRSNRR